MDPQGDGQRALEALEGRLGGLDIKEETKEQDDAETKAVLKQKFAMFVQKAKGRLREGDIEAGIKYYQKAYNVHKSDKVVKKIKQLEAALAEPAYSSSEDDDNPGLVDCGDGFHLSEQIYYKLYPYQKEGIAWFWKLYTENKGGILGDDMGLGKTVQVISFLSGMFQQGHINRVMIMMPVSLLANWQKEFRKWAPEIRVLDFHSRDCRDRNLEKIQSRNGVCLTTYGLAMTCNEKFSKDKYGREFLWDYIILDEGHKIKNSSNKTTLAVRSIPATNHFILTGTPIQNNLREMWALFDYVCEGKLLGTSRSFKQEYENPIVRARERDATAYEKRIGNEMSAHLRELIAPHFLRRTKALLEPDKKAESPEEQVDGGEPTQDGSPETARVDEKPQEKKGVKQAKLTRKNDLIIWLYLSETQLQIYEDFLELDRVKEILNTTKSPLAELNVMKKICDHPRLLSTMACDQLGLNEDQEDIDEEYHWCAPPVELLTQESGKLVFLVQLLEQLKKEGHRTLVFSQSRKMLDIMQKVLEDKGIKLIRVDGTIRNLAERESRIDEFQTDSSYSVFLLTTQVGGVGLTLTAADRVVIFDPSWNPATDAQAVDRAYRIGQKKTVVVYRFITCGTLEEKIYRKQVFKQAITKQTTGSSINPMRYFTRQELHELFKLDDPRSSTTQIQLSQMHSANRVSDISLDEHIAFLHSTDIFGISDHDLLFTKEAVVAQEEVQAAREMGDAIQAKVRRAADIMRTESSQARRNAAVPNTPKISKKKTSQTKIDDHMSIFKPSREDSKRFLPKKIQPKAEPDLIDITMLDKKIDDDDLDRRFSAINIHDRDDKTTLPKSADRTSNIDQIVLDDSVDKKFFAGTRETTLSGKQNGLDIIPQKPTTLDISQKRESMDLFKSSDSIDDVGSTSRSTSSGESPRETSMRNSPGDSDEASPHRSTLFGDSPGNNDEVSTASPRDATTKVSPGNYIKQTPGGSATSVVIPRDDDDIAKRSPGNNEDVHIPQNNNDNSDVEDFGTVPMSSIKKKRQVLISDDEDNEDVVNTDTMKDVPKMVDESKEFGRNIHVEDFDMNPTKGSSSVNKKRSVLISDNEGENEVNVDTRKDVPRILEKSTVFGKGIRHAENGSSFVDSSKNSPTNDVSCLSKLSKDAHGEEARRCFELNGEETVAGNWGNDVTPRVDTHDKRRSDSMYGEIEDSSEDEMGSGGEYDDSSMEKGSIKTSSVTRSEDDGIGRTGTMMDSFGDKEVDDGISMDTDKSLEDRYVDEGAGVDRDTGTKGDVGGNGGCEIEHVGIMGLVDNEEDVEGNGDSEEDVGVDGDSEEDVGGSRDNEEDVGVDGDSEEDVEGSRDNEEDVGVDGDSEEDVEGSRDNEEDVGVDGDSEDDVEGSRANEEDVGGNRAFEGDDSEAEDGGMEHSNEDVGVDRDSEEHVGGRRGIEGEDGESVDSEDEDGIDRDIKVENIEDRGTLDTEEDVGVDRENGEQDNEGEDGVDRDIKVEGSEDEGAEMVDSEEDVGVVQDNKGENSDDDESGEDVEESTDDNDDDSDEETGDNEGDLESSRNTSGSVTSSSADEVVRTAKKPSSKSTASEDNSSENDDDKENALPRGSIERGQSNNAGKVLSQKERNSQPFTKTSCCPRGLHVSNMVNIRRCPCVMTSEQREAYSMHINSAKRCEKSNEMEKAKNHFGKALQLCDSDERLYLRIKKVCDILKARK